MNKRIVLILLSLLPAIIAVVSYIYFDLDFYLGITLISFTFLFLSFTLSKDKMQVWDLMVKYEQEEFKKGNYKNSIQKYMHEHTVSFCFISIIVVILLFSMIYLGFNTPYVLRPDKFHRVTVPLMGIFFIVCIIEMVIISRKERKGENKLPIFTLIGLCLLFIFGVIKISAIFLLKYSNAPLISSNAFVVEYSDNSYRTRHKSPNKYKLRFDPNQAISNKEFWIVAETHAQAGDCLSVQYRENAVVIEVRPIKNLGKMSEKECLAQ
ncbi:MAG: hypothetical protein IKH45_02900 [Neisseriaceae bacterium]|nr:hypothetical protein [Neisseriaceae bacterium]